MSLDAEIPDPPQKPQPHDLVGVAFTLTVYGHLFDDELDAVAEDLGRVVAASKTGPGRGQTSQTVVALGSRRAGNSL